MTGFGQASGESRQHAMTVTLRGVNHRYLEIKLRLDDEHQASEQELRELLQSKLFRGRVDVGVEIRRLAEREATVEVQRAVVQAAHMALHGLVEEGLIVSELTAGDLLRMPDAVSIRLAADRWDAEDRHLMLEVGGRALDQFLDARRVEGERLALVLAERLGTLEELVARLGTLRDEALEEVAAGLEARLERLIHERHPELPSEIDPARLAQEVAILADKSDVREELDRLDSHLVHFHEIIGRASLPGSVGKRLDFLLQEIFRELNTLGAKCRNATMIRTVLEAKGVAEQVREQVQNVE